MSGTLSNIFNGQPIPQQPTGSDTSTNGPLWLQQYVYNLANAATNLSGQPYSQFPGPTIAAPSDATLKARDLAASNVGNYQPDINQAGALVQAGSTPLSAGDIQKYLNPYTTNVVGALQQAANTNLFQNQLPQIQDRFVSAGQSRSPQEMQATNNALYQSNQALDQATAQALSAGYSGALTTAGQQQQVQQQGGAQMGALGALTQQLGGYDVGQLAAAGQSTDVTNQANINSALNQFYAQQQWPYQNLAFASNIIRGQPVPSNTQTVGLAPATQTSYTASPLTAFIGTTLGGQSLLNNTARPAAANTNTTTTTPTGTTTGGLARGGRITTPGRAATPYGALVSHRRAA